MGQVIDENGNTVPVMAFGAAHKVAMSATSAKNASAFAEATKVISVTLTQPGYIKLGGNSVTAANTDHYLSANIPYDISLGDAKATYCACIRDSADGFMFISERK